MNRRTALVLCCTGLLSIPAFGANESHVAACCAKRAAAASTKAEKAGKLRCSLTGKVMDKCCCEQREGKTYCTLADKTVEKCCCTPVAEQSAKK
jgi:hypothetical protein